MAATGLVIWFTGLSGAGKSSLALALKTMLDEAQRQTVLLDGDALRQGLNQDLGFSEQDRDENVRRVAELGKLLQAQGLIVICALISPLARQRALARQIIGAESFLEVFVDTPLAVCEARDVKGLYRRARSGQLAQFTGVSSPYEAPLAADIVLRGDGADTAQTVLPLAELVLGRLAR